MDKIFNTDKHIKLGIWGLGRGLNFIRSAAALNIDVVAGCDIHPHMRANFQKIAPNAYVTDNEDDFLARDFDAVLIATYFPDHCKHALKALDAGQHVMCEVTSFGTPADGVKLVEAVEKSGKVYNLLENYPFTKPNMFLKKLWDEGFFGEFMYGEYEYVHDCRTLCYAYNVDGGLPVEPGYTLHNWRCALDGHLYNTHSLGPLMNITGRRPVRVEALPCDVMLPGYPVWEEGTHGRICPSLITMDNGGLMRNLMGSTTNDNHMAGRLFGTNASAENIRDGLKIRVGGCGNGTFLSINPDWPADLGKLAEATGHGGGDFWELYFFARQILTGEPAPWNVYAAADVTITGLLATRSARQNGTPIDIPDFRNKSDRDKFRNDNHAYKMLDATHIFPEGHDPAISGNFTPLMVNLFPMNGNNGILLAKRAWDGMKLFPYLADNDSKLNVVKSVAKLIDELPNIADWCRQAEKIMNAYPDTLPGKTIRQSLDYVDLKKVYDTEASVTELRNWLTEFAKNR